MAAAAAVGATDDDVIDVTDDPAEEDTLGSPPAPAPDSDIAVLAATGDVLVAIADDVTDVPLASSEGASEGNMRVLPVTVPVKAT